MKAARLLPPHSIQEAIEPVRRHSFYVLEKCYAQTLSLLLITYSGLSHASIKSHYWLHFYEFWMQTHIAIVYRIDIVADILDKEEEKKNKPRLFGNSP